MGHFLVIFIFSFLTTQTANSKTLWYGTLTFSKMWTEETSFNFNEGDNFYPGWETQRKVKSWEGIVNLKAPGQKVVSASYDFSDRYHRVQDKITYCPGNSEGRYLDDQQINRTIRTSPVKTQNETLEIYFDNKGAYSFTLSTGSFPLDNTAFNIYERRFRINACQYPPHSGTEEERISSDSMPAVAFKIAGLRDPQRPNEISGSFNGKDSEGADFRYEWRFTTLNPQVEAKIQGPIEFSRGDIITLDGINSKGSSLNYEWSFIPVRGCLMPAENVMKKWNTQQIQFKALCSFRARLKVKSGDDVDTSEQLITVKPRTDWKIAFTSNKGDPLTSRLVAEYLHFGVNQCVHHDKDFVSGHMVHTDSPNSSTWLGSGYEIEEVSDDGPFHGAWFLVSEDLKIDRIERVNKSLMPGGEVYDLNVKNNNLNAVKRLLEQVVAHESQHSILIEEMLKFLGPKKDPAAQIEDLVGDSKDQLQLQADMKIRDVEQLLRDATSETQVKNKLKKMGFTEDSIVWLPSISGDPIKKNLGPLWDLGDGQ